MFDVHLPYLTLRDYCTRTHCGINAETMYCAALTYIIKKDGCLRVGCLI